MLSAPLRDVKRIANLILHRFWEPAQIVKACPKPDKGLKKRLLCHLGSEIVISLYHAVEIGDLPLNRQNHVKHAAFAGRAFYRDLAAMLIHDFCADCQAQADAVRLRGEKRVENALQIFCFNT